MSCTNTRVINCFLKRKQIFQEHSQFESETLLILVFMVLFSVCGRDNKRIISIVVINMGFFFNASKCQFLVLKGKLLGHIIS